MESLSAAERKKQEASIRNLFPAGEQATWPKWLRVAWLFGFLPDEFRRAHGEAYRSERADRLLAEVRRTGAELSAEASRVANETAARRPEIDVPFGELPPWQLEMPDPDILAAPPLGHDSLAGVVRTADLSEFKDQPPRTTVLVAEDGEAYVGEMPEAEYLELCKSWKNWSTTDRLEYLTGFSPAEHLEQQQEAERIWTAGRLLDEIRSAGIEATVEDVRFLEEVFARPMPCDAPHRETIEHRKRPSPGPLFENVPPDVLAALGSEQGFRIRRARDRESLGPHLGRANDGHEYFAEARAANVHGRRLRQGESWESRAAIVFRLLLAAREKAHDRLGDDVNFPYRPKPGETKNEAARMILRHMLYVLGFIDHDNTRDSDEFRSGERLAAIEAAVADARERKVANAMRLTRSDLLEHAVLAGFAAARLLGPEESERVEKALRRLAEQEEHVELFAAEGRAVKAENDRRRAALICKLYKAVRPSFPSGQKGNGPANRAVAERYEMQTGETIHERTVRDTVKRAGLSESPPRRRKD
ncbi:MAG: hypothetical protein WCC69_04830 [Pirellulales bacterium]